MHILLLLIFVTYGCAFKVFANTNCSDDEFFCGNFECISATKQCDGTADCSDGSDELDCDMYQCKGPDFFKCKNHHCISAAFVCDGENDCADFSDEDNCKNFSKNFQKNVTCSSEEWQCSNKLCIPKEWVCNGQTECLDGSDEHLGCSSTIVCDGFKCKNGHCIFQEWHCDGHDDCRDNSDEQNCDAQMEIKDCTLENDHFLCADGKSCIPLSKACDNTTQCPDESDEGPLCHQLCDDCQHRCIPLPTGSKCICPKGYHTRTNNFCEDINECETFGICDQKCINTPGSYKCHCEEHYSLQSDMKNCKAHFGEPSLYISLKKEIRGYFLRSKVYFSVAKDLKQVVGVDFDGDHVYWTEIYSEHESIVRSLKNGDKREVLLTSGLGAPEDLQIDFITKNIYFTDAVRRHIGVCTNDGTHCAVLMNKDIHKPRGIALNSLEGEMFWTDWGQKAEIGRSFMDGSEPISFVSSDIHWPNGLTVDHPNSRLYWTDAKLMTLESIKLDGTDRRSILKNIVKHPYAIAVFENRLYWSDWATHSVQSCNKFTGKEHTTIIKEQNEYIYGISIYHPNNFINSTFNPCAKALCSNICLLKSKTYTCACPQGKILGLDRHTCETMEKMQKIMIGTDSFLFEVEHQILGKHKMEVIPAFVKKLGALTYNSIRNSIYASDLYLRRIIEFDLSTDDVKPLDIFDLGQVTCMGYDYLGNNLYWGDSERGTLEIYSFNTQSRTILLHDMNGEVPESLVLVPEEGVMFVAFHHKAGHSHIDRLFMDGTSRTHSLEHGLLGPICLCYDFSLHRIFVSDSGTGNIESTSIEGDDRHGFKSLQTSPIGITTLKNDVFWVNFNSKELYWSDKYNMGDQLFNKKITLDIDGKVEKLLIASITPNRIGLSPCQHNNGGCSHFCLHSQKHIVCGCPIGSMLDQDNKTCIKRTECTHEQFFCSKSNVCISKKYRCDKIKQCPSGEDEFKCMTDSSCTKNQFQCRNGHCIDLELRCNLHFECKDKSDELNCSHIGGECPSNHFRCKNGNCISQRMVCDGIKDCLHEEDEENCVSTSCREKEFRCLSGTCISKEWECDRDFDCPDFSDEHPGCPKCDSTSFSCLNGKCIDKSFVCDKQNDCGDNSDETSCDINEQVCKEDEFTCSVRSLACLPKTALCNGTIECPNSEDEISCSENCQSDKFYCKNKKCIPRDWLCDHSDDCGDNSDESVCNHTVIIQQEMHQSCQNKFQCKTGNCIDFSLVCNGVHDCFDGSDENGVCNSSCQTLNNPCDHLCVKTPSGPTCKCDTGFSLQGDGKTCEDIDECDSHLSPCSQICNNIPGLYICDCFEGFALRSDRKSCKSEGDAMSMIYVFNNQIREMSQKHNSIKLIFSEPTAAITGLDVSVASKVIYFSVETSGTIVKIYQNDTHLEFLEEVGQPQKIALDWGTNNIYYVNNDATFKTISVCNFDAKSCANLINLSPHQQISALSVDATNKFLFYSSVSWWIFNSPNYVIYRTNLDGSDVHELVKSSPGYITGLTHDLFKKDFFYIDQHNNKLFRMKYDGSARKQVVANFTRPTGLNFFENQLFFQSTGFMFKCNVYSSYFCDSFHFKSDLFTILQESKQPAIDNSCTNNTCSHLCVASKSSYKCLCEDGKLINPIQKCHSIKRESDSDMKKHLLSVYHHEHYGSHSGALITGIMICLCLIIIGSIFFYVVKRKNSGTFNVISMRFNNPGYGLEPIEDNEKLIIKPGEHEYTNPREISGSPNLALSDIAEK